MNALQVIARRVGLEQKVVDLSFLVDIANHPDTLKVGQFVFKNNWGLRYKVKGTEFDIVLYDDGTPGISIDSDIGNVSVYGTQLDVQVREDQLENLIKTLKAKAVELWACWKFMSSKNFKLGMNRFDAEQPNYSLDVVYQHLANNDQVSILYRLGSETLKVTTEKGAKKIEFKSLAELKSALETMFFDKVEKLDKISIDTKGTRQVFFGKVDKNVLKSLEEIFKKHGFDEVKQP